MVKKPQRKKSSLVVDSSQCSGFQAATLAEKKAASAVLDKIFADGSPAVPAVQKMQSKSKADSPQRGIASKRLPSCGRRKVKRKRDQVSGTDETAGADANANKVAVEPQELEGLTPEELDRENKRALSVLDQVLQQKNKESVSSDDEHLQYAPKKAGQKTTDKGNLKVFLGGLPWKLDAETVEREFEETCGEIESFSMPTNKNDGRPMGVAFIVFSTPEAVARALQFDGKNYHGRKIRARVADPMAVGKGSVTKDKSSSQPGQSKDANRIASKSSKGPQAIHKRKRFAVAAEQDAVESVLEKQQVGLAGTRRVVSHKAKNAATAAKETAGGEPNSMVVSQGKGFKKKKRPKRLEMAI